MAYPQISSLSIHHFRNIKQADLNTSTINVISGNNGSGKSSLLESLYYLAHAKSFRTAKPHILIHHDAPSFSLFSTLTTESGSATVGVQRNTNHQQKLKFNKEQESSAVVARHIPMQFIDSNCYQYFTDGPAIRRQYLNWGLFHMKQSFLTLWKNTSTVLKQRNAALRSGNINDIGCWDSQLIPLCEEVHSLRTDYTDRLIPIVNNLLKELLGTGYSQLKLRYQPGWNTDRPLALILQERIQRDIELGYTQAGVHRADLQLYAKNKGAHEYLSQGQMKLAAYALKIAQCIIQKEDLRKSTIFLVDDLQAELDQHKQQAILQLFSELDSQCFYTSLDPTRILSMLQNHEDVSSFSLCDGSLVE